MPISVSPEAEAKVRKIPDFSARLERFIHDQFELEQWRARRVKSEVADIVEEGLREGLATAGRAGTVRAEPCTLRPVEVAAARSARPPAGYRRSSSASGEILPAICSARGRARAGSRGPRGSAGSTAGIPRECGQGRVPSPRHNSILRPRRRRARLGLRPVRRATGPRARTACPRSAKTALPPCERTCRGTGGCPAGFPRPRRVGRERRGPG